MDVWTSLKTALISNILDPGERIYWGSLLGALFLVVLRSGPRLGSNLRTLVSRKIWLHPSSRGDVSLIVGNTLLRSLVLPGTLGLGTVVATSVAGGLKALWSEPLTLTLPNSLVLFSFTLSLFLADDFGRFYAHYLQHRVPWLWCFHQVHHSAKVLTPLTLYRTHPVDMAMAIGRDALSYGMVTGVFFFAFGRQLSTFDILGVNAFGFLFNIFGANLRHSQVWVDYGRLETWFISPAAHQIHHSIDPAHYDKNFGVCLAIWDRLWHTHVDARRVTYPLEFGLENGQLAGEKQALWVLYGAPFLELYAALGRQRIKLLGSIRSILQA